MISRRHPFIVEPQKAEVNSPVKNTSKQGIAGGGVVYLFEAVKLQSY
jgi:hypothetical protein